MKNKNLLTETKPVPSRRCFYLGMSAVLLLGGCDPSYTYHSLTGTRVKEDTPGMRRTPVLNKRSHSAPSTTAPAETSTPPSAEVTPYDQYDANGDEVSTASEGAPESGNFFTRLLGLDDKPAAKDPSQYARKPLPGNPYSPLTSAAAPVVDAQVKDIATPEPVAAPDAQAAKEPAVAQAVNEAVSAPVSEPIVDNNASASATVDEAAPQKQEGFFDRIASFFDGGSKQSEQQQEDTSQPAGEVAKETVKEPEASAVPDVKVVKEVPGYNAGEADSGSDKESLLGSISSHFVSDSKENEAKATYPQLSTVPATPTEFDSVKQEQQQNLNELKSEHSTAMQDKEALDREVSGLPPEEAGLAPQPIPQPDLVMPAPPAPAAEEKLPTSDSLAKAPEEKSIFSHFTFSDPIEPSVPAEPVKESAVEEHPAAPLQEEAKQPQPSFEPAAKLFEANTSSKEAGVEEPPATKQQEEARSPEPVFTPEEANIEEQPSAQPQEEAGQSQPVFEPAEKLLEDTASLPSPEIIKSMRPSRYEARRKQAQNSDY